MCFGMLTPCCWELLSLQRSNTAMRTSISRISNALLTLLQWHLQSGMSCLVTQFFFLIHLLLFSTCFRQLCTHHQENLPYSLYMDDCLVCRAHTALHTRQSFIQSDIYQVSHRYGKFSWWWAHSCLKHVEKSNKRINCAPSWFCLQDYTRMHSQQT